MSIAELKVDLHSKIDHAEDWDSLTLHQQNRVLKGESEADEGLGIPLNQINKRLRGKYGIPIKPSS